MNDEEIKKIIDEDNNIALELYLNYIERRSKEIKNYQPPPLFRALLLAITGAKKEDRDGNYSGVSVGETVHGNPVETYAVVIKKEKEQITILAIKDAVFGYDIPTYLIFKYFQIYMRLEKYPDSEIDFKDGVEILNYFFPEYNLKALYSKKDINEAKQIAKRLLIHNQINHPDSEQILKIINSKTKWEDYPNHIRCFIGTLWGGEKFPNEQVIVNTTPFPSVPKYKIIHTALHLMCNSTLLSAKQKKT